MIKLIIAYDYMVRSRRAQAQHALKVAGPIDRVRLYAWIYLNGAPLA